MSDNNDDRIKLRIFGRVSTLVRAFAKSGWNFWKLCPKTISNWGFLAGGVKVLAEWGWIYWKLCPHFGRSRKWRFGRMRLKLLETMLSYNNDFPSFKLEIFGRVGGREAETIGNYALTQYRRPVIQTENRWKTKWRCGYCLISLNKVWYYTCM